MGATCCGRQHVRTLHHREAQLDLVVLLQTFLHQHHYLTFPVGPLGAALQSHRAWPLQSPDIPTCAVVRPRGFDAGHPFLDERLHEFASDLATLLRRKFPPVYRLHIAQRTGRPLELILFDAGHGLVGGPDRPNVGARLLLVTCEHPAVQLHRGDDRPTTPIPLREWRPSIRYQNHGRPARTFMVADHVLPADWLT